MVVKAGRSRGDPIGQGFFQISCPTIATNLQSENYEKTASCRQ